jgi:invasion protein IalB
MIATAALALALASGAAAQDQTTPPEEPTADAPAAEAPATEAPAATETPAEGEQTSPAGAQATAGEAAAPAEPEVLEIVRDTFGDWQVRCAPEGDNCFMYQLALDAQENPVAEFSLLKLPIEAEATAGVTVVTPLGTLLPAGLVMQIDNGERRQYPFSWCSQVGCFARFGLNDASINSMKRGKAGKVALVSVGAPEAPVTLDISLSGFTAAYDSLNVPEELPGEAPLLAPAN